MNRTTRRGAAVVSLLLLTATACSPGGAGDGGDGVSLKAGQFSWMASEIEIGILSAIVEDHPELGVSEIEATPVDPAAGWVGLEGGDLDLLPEVNLPNQQSFADETADSTELVSETYGGAAQGWFVPRYLVEPGGAAEGLTSIDQLADPEWADKVGGVLYDADPGWVTTEQNAARIEAFDLALEHSTSSEAALIAQLQRAYDGEEPVLLYFYRPHWLFTQFDLVQLEEPNPYEDDCFVEGGRSDCAIPTLAAWIATNDELAEKAPEFAALLENVRLPLEDVEGMLAESENEGTEPADLARTWVDDHEAEIGKWLE